MCNLKVAHLARIGKAGGMRSALIVGGRGQSGLAIGRRLVDDGWTVTATTSGPIPDQAAAPGVAWVPLDRDQAGGLEPVVGGVIDVVVDVTAFQPRHAVQLLALGDRIGSAIVLSTLSVYTDSEGRTLDASDVIDFPAWPVPIPEEWPTVPGSDASYSARKAAIEELLRRDAPWPVTIVRPGAIHGRHSHHLREWYFIKRAIDHRKQVVLPFRGESVFQPTASVNLAELVSLAAARPGRRTLNCGDMDPPTVAQISCIVDDLMGCKTGRELVDGPPPEPNVGDHPWAVPRPVVADMSRARSELGYRQRSTYRDALAQTLPWAVGAASGRDWRQVFATLAGYPVDLFDYDAEDRYLSRPRPG
jgi:nucleoside-diphosphate-sugar epimerase